MNELNVSVDDPIVADGYTQPGFIEGVEGLHRGVLFEFRPMLPEEVDEIEFKCSQLTPAAARVASAERLAMQVVSWDIANKEGQKILINGASVRRLRPALFVKMWGVVRGILATDIHPSWLKGGSAEKATEQITSLGALQVVGIDVKN